MKKYYTVRIIAAFLFMSSFGLGLLSYAKYGKWVGCVTFVVLAISGVFLHKVADKLDQTKL
jgi:hypothetical protein